MTNPYDPKFGYSQEEIRILQAHDQGEELHPFIASQVMGGEFACQECGDTEEGLMHNNTWRNVEPLMDLDGCQEQCTCTYETVEVTLRITYPVGSENHPATWDWPSLLDVSPEYVEVV